MDCTDRGRVHGLYSLGKGPWTVLTGGGSMHCTDGGRVLGLY